MAYKPYQVLIDFFNYKNYKIALENIFNLDREII
jgi:hypothetical protein